MTHPSLNALEDCIPSLRRYARLLASSAMDADDLVQESLVRMIERLRNSGGVINLRAYLFTVLRNCHREQIARNGRTPTSVPIDEFSNSVACDPAQPWRMELNDLAAAMTRLPSEQREVLVLVGIEGMTYGEASKVIEAPVGTVMSRLSRGRDSLRRMMPGTQDHRRSNAASSTRARNIGMGRATLTDRQTPGAAGSRTMTRSG